MDRKLWTNVHIYGKSMGKPKNNQHSWRVSYIYTGWWFGTCFISTIYGIISFPLTFIFFKVVTAPPTGWSYVVDDNASGDVISCNCMRWFAVCCMASFLHPWLGFMSLSSALLLIPNNKKWHERSGPCCFPHVDHCNSVKLFYPLII